MTLGMQDVVPLSPVQVLRKLQLTITANELSQGELHQVLNQLRSITHPPVQLPPQSCSVALNMSALPPPTTNLWYSHDHTRSARTPGGGVLNPLPLYGIGDTLSPTSATSVLFQVSDQPPPTLEPPFTRNLKPGRSNHMAHVIAWLSPSQTKTNGASSFRSIHGDDQSGRVMSGEEGT